MYTTRGDSRESTQWSISVASLRDIFVSAVHCWFSLRATDSRLHRGLVSVRPHPFRVGLTSFRWGELMIPPQFHQPSPSIRKERVPAR